MYIEIVAAVTAKNVQCGFSSQNCSFVQSTCRVELFSSLEIRCSLSDGVHCRHICTDLDVPRRPIVILLELLIGHVSSLSNSPFKRKRETETCHFGVHCKTHLVALLVVEWWTKPGFLLFFVLLEIMHFKFNAVTIFLN